MYTKKQKIEIYIYFFLAVFAIEIFHIFIARRGVLKIYESGQDLPWTPPLHLLLPLWTVLYIFMAVAGAIVYIKRASHIRSFALSSWFVQLALNTLWPVFFYYVPIQIASPILITILFITLCVFMFYGFLLERNVFFLSLPFFLMVVYKMIFLWIFYILNIDLL